MTQQEAIALCKELAGIEAGAFIPETLKSDIRRLYRYVTGDTLKHCNCPDLYHDAIILILLRMKQDTKQRNYILKRGIVIQTADSSEVYTRDNITDEIAKDYLAKFPNRVYIFEAIPEAVDVDTIDAEEPTEVEVAPKRKSKKSKA
jgi:hypothetical protein